MNQKHKPESQANQLGMCRVIKGGLEAKSPWAGDQAY